MNRNLFYILGAGFLLVLICVGLLASPASAYPLVRQGDDVYVNDTVDISAVTAGYNYLAWCGAYSDWLSPYNDSILYSQDLPERKSGYYSFWLDPEIFANRTGWWYKWNGAYESNANLRAFRVVPGTKHYWYTTEGNVTNETYEPTITYQNETEMIIPPPIEVRHVADYLIARGDSWNTTWNSTAKLWVFGYYNAASMGLYDFPNVNDTFTLDKNITRNFMPGNYKMVIQSWSNNSQNFNARYNADKDQIEYFNPDIFQILHVDLKPLGLNQEVRLQKFREIWNYTRDNWTEFNLTVQNPSIEITELEQKEWTDNWTYLHLLGYTNTQNGTPLTFIIDKDKQTPRSLKYSRFTTTAQGTGMGDMRWFEIQIPLVWENIEVGEHSVTANTSVGGEMKYDYYIWQTPADTYVPPKMVKYVGGNEYIAPEIQVVTIVMPTPTPEVIVQKVMVEVTPSNEQVLEQQNIAMQKIVIVAALGLVVLGFIASGIVYGYSVWRRLK